jgi:hypothetical protein
MLLRVWGRQLKRRPLGKRLDDVVARPNPGGGHRDICASERRAAGRAILAAEPMEVGSVEDLKKDLDDMHARHLA